MPGGRQFEDLPVWQAGRELVRRVYALTRSPRVAADPGFCDQVRRAAVSITNNIAEGHERGTTIDLVVFLFYAKGSAGEVRSMLWNAGDVGYVSPAEGEELRGLARSLSVQLYQWISSMQTPDFDPGPKYRNQPPVGVRRWEAYLEAQGWGRLADGRLEAPAAGRAAPRDGSNGRTE
jgi:four helix bundle protein